MENETDNFAINIIGSGSSGNCLLVDGAIMIDCGLSRKKIENSGFDLSQLDLLLVSHRHGDHVNLPFVRYLLKMNKRMYLPHDVVTNLENEGKINVDDYRFLITEDETLKPAFVEANDFTYKVELHPTDHYDITNFAFTITRSDGKELLYATDLKTVNRSKRAKGIAYLGKFDTLILEGNYDEVYLRKYINSALHVLDPEWKSELLSDQTLDDWIRANRFSLPKEFKSPLYRAVQNMRHLSKQQARLYAKQHLKPGGKYYEVHRSSMFYAAPSAWG